MSVVARFEQHVAPSFAYPIVFTHNAAAPLNPSLAEFLTSDHDGARRLVFVDDGLAAARPTLIADLEAYLEHHGLSSSESPILVPGGEPAKDGWIVVQDAVERMQKHRLCRHSTVLAIGGGAMLDALGLAAALFHRGVRLVRMPSTTLAQGDSGVGVKNGVNWLGAKNLVGCFAPPWAVLCDLELSRTLDKPLVMDGVAEALKVAVIKDAAFFASLQENASRLAACDWDAVDDAIIRSAQIHARHIVTSGDPFEMGTARPLDFGHWAAHRLEVLSDYSIRHGQGVALGIAIDTMYAARRGMLARDAADAILDVLRRLNGTLAHPLLRETDPHGRPIVLDGLEHFREHLGGRLAVTLPTAIGRSVEVDEIDEALMAACVLEIAEDA